jgi:hypothetical protein
MRTYRLSDHACRLAMLKRALFALAVILLCGAGGMLYLASRSALTLRTAWPLGFFVLVGCLFLPFATWRARAALGSYRLTLSDDRLTQSMRGATDVTVERGEVTEIVESPGARLFMVPGTLLTVRTTDLRRQVIVLDGLEEYADLCARLAEWHEVKTLPPQTLASAALRQAAVLVPAACIVAAFYWSDPYVVVPFALAGAASTLAALWMMQRSPHAPIWAKVVSWVILLPVALLVARAAWVCGLIGK